MFEWSDLRYFLAMARTGSSLAAAEVTRVSQSTVSRRVAVLEDALGLKLFERLQTGSRLTDQGETLMRAAQDVEAAVQALETAARVASRRLSGIIRFTMPPEGSGQLTSAALTAFMDRHPGVRIELLSTERFLDVAAGEADVALRAGPPPTQPDLVVRKIAELDWAGYCSRDVLARDGAVTGPDDWRGRRVIGAEGQLAGAPALKWLAERAPEYAVRVSTVGSMIAFAKAGAGLALVPVSLGDREPDLVRCHPPIPGAGSPVWLVTRDDTRRTPHVRAFIDFLSAHISAVRRLTDEGERPT